MNPLSRKYKILLCFLSSILIFGQLFPLNSSALADYPLLNKIITAYNLKALKEDLNKDSFRGEQGILRIRPEIAKSFGISVFIDQEYLDSMDLFKKAHRALDMARDIMFTQKKESFSGEYAKKIAEYFLIYKESHELAKKKLLAYHSRLNPSNDDRFDENICIKVMNQLLEESLKKTDNRLRDALGYFYNLCQGLNNKTYPLTSENVHFVNHVFHRFLQQASKKALNRFDLDKDYGHGLTRIAINWKKVIGEEGAQYIPILETGLKNLGNRLYRVDPLLFMALIKRESNFDPLAISPVGAAGLTQIMPTTAKNLGMRNVYAPDYFHKAVSLMGQEREKRREAFKVLFRINEKNKIQYAKLARKLIQESLALKQKKERLFARYKQELVRNHTDDRLKPKQAIEYGLKYFARLIKMQKGDVSLALASYNAGPHKVRRFKGIPPYAETIHFRNKVLGFYRNYLRKAKETL